MKYSEIFKRNIGLFTQKQQRALETASVTIAGSSSLCGLEALTLARFGIKDLKILIHSDENVGEDAPQLMNGPDLSFAREVGDTTPCTGAREMYLDSVVPETTLPFIQGSNIILDLLPFKNMDIKTFFADQAKTANIFYISAHSLNMGCAVFLFHPDGIAPETIFQEMSASMRKSLDYSGNAAASFFKAGMASTEAALILTGLRQEYDLVIAPRFSVFNALDRSFTIQNMNQGHSHGATA